MKAICEGRQTRQEVIAQTIEQYRAVYMQAQQRLNVLRNASFSLLLNMTIWLTLPSPYASMSWARTHERVNSRCRPPRRRLL